MFFIFGPETSWSGCFSGEDCCLGGDGSLGGGEACLGGYDFVGGGDFGAEMSDCVDVIVSLGGSDSKD